MPAPAGHSSLAAVCDRHAVTNDIPLDQSGPEGDLGLHAGLASVAGLVAGSRSLEEMLTQVATLTMLTVPGADGAGVTMMEADEPDMIVASTKFVRDVDRIQYRVGEGPCISAAAERRTTGSGALGQDAAWPTFGPLAAESGVHSALSLPLIVDGRVLGALNVYAHVEHAFSDSARRVGERFAQSAAVAIYNARLFDQAEQRNARLQSALVTRSTIDRAIGIIMARSGISGDEAFVRLRIMSQHQHIKLNLVAQKLVDEAVRRTRAQQPDLNE